MSDPAIGMLVAVEWLDATTGGNDEQSNAEILSESLYVYTSYGLLVRADDHCVAVAADRRSDGRYRGVTYIPRGMIRTITPQTKPQRKPRVRGTSRRDAGSGSETCTGDCPVVP